MQIRRNKTAREFGDFQTPTALAISVCNLLIQAGIEPASILEPTCGTGSFVWAAERAFPKASVTGFDINPLHLVLARRNATRESTKIQHGDFFQITWESVLQSCSDPVLIIGNPPWVTSSELGSLASSNLPRKTNFHGRKGIEALTGKSNFDISEWMLLNYLDWLESRGGWIAVLVKSAVARKVLHFAWKRDYSIKSAAMFKVDAMRYFGAAVDACVLLLAIEPGNASKECTWYRSLTDQSPMAKVGYCDGVVVSDLTAYMKWRGLAGRSEAYAWRSGIKHDCSKVMELTKKGGLYVNGFGDEVFLEESFLYPLLKSSDVNKGSASRSRFLLVTQRNPKTDTALIQRHAPSAWAYLQQHESSFSKRASSIYRGRPAFSIFGVGDYSFTPWKVAISGLYKTTRFSVIEPINGRPVVFDDTVYFLPCRSEEEARFLASILNSDPVQEFLGSMVFWSDKRPITIDLLKRLDIKKAAAELGQSNEYDSLQGVGEPQSQQLMLFN